jgi:hypothetical protein
MVSQRNPFPGMNPFLERCWHTVHPALIGYVRDALAVQLPDDLHARPEETVVITGRERARVCRPDVAITQRLKQDPPWANDDENGGGVAVVEPVVMRLIEEKHRWVEIREAGGRLITVIELLSPANKTGNGCDDYRNKQQAYIDGRVNLVEIDLLRNGEHVLAFPRDDLENPDAISYAICIFRASDRWERTVYPVPLEQRLPAVPVPLRKTDADVALELQPLIDRAYEFGRHWQDDYAQPLDPPLPAAQQAWVAGRLRAAGLME